MELSKLAPGQHGVIIGVDDASRESRRLADIGFVPGTPITVERRAPLGDPTVYVVRGTRIALRRSAAALIDVHALTDEPPDELLRTDAR
jgi:Fe2+ transport system protein FeoA